MEQVLFFYPLYSSDTVAVRGGNPLATLLAMLAACSPARSVTYPGHTQDHRHHAGV